MTLFAYRTSRGDAAPGPHARVKRSSVLPTERTLLEMEVNVIAQFERILQTTECGYNSPAKKAERWLRKSERDPRWLAKLRNSTQHIPTKISCTENQQL